MSGQRWRFGPFEVDLQEQRLWGAGQVVPVTRKALALLASLIARPGKLVTKGELFATVWAGTAVTDSALSRVVRELRVALGDDALSPTYIETAHGLGFRFIASVSAIESPTEVLPVGTPLPSHLVGREREMQVLGRALDAASTRLRQVVFVTGDPGIGKTSLVEAFLGRQAAAAGACVARGACIEQYGTGEAYLPILGALEDLARQRGAEALREALTRYAPTWLAQLPWLAHGADPMLLQRTLASASAQRMVREIAQLFEVLALERPLVLWLEDLHWSDPSSLDVLSFLARRPEPSHLLVIGSYRPADAPDEAPLARLANDLTLRRACTQLPLEPLGADSIASYLRSRFPTSSGPEIDELAAFMYRHTDGNPLFTVSVVDDLVRRGDLAEDGDGGVTRRPIAELDAGMPDSLRQLIYGQFDRLDAADGRVVEAAAVAGFEFSSAAVAAALQRDVGDVDECCTRLAEGRRFLQARGAVTWPDGTVAGRFAFTHALHWQAIFERVPQSRRASWQGLIGQREEQAFRDSPMLVASELAMRFEAAGDLPRSIAYLRQAGAAALARCAYAECIQLLRHALDLVNRLPGERRSLHELELLLPLGAALMAVRGYASSEVEDTYRRALWLCRQGAETGNLVRAQRGLWNVALVRADLAQAESLSDELLDAAERGVDGGLLFDALAKHGETCLHRGDFTGARRSLERALGLPASRHGDRTPRELPRVAGYLAWVLWYTGYPEQALGRAEDAMAFAGEVGSPHSSAFALGFVGWLHAFRGDMARLQAVAQEQRALSIEHDLVYWRVWSDLLQGIVTARSGDARAGAQAMASAVGAFRAMGAEVGVAHFLCAQAEAMLAGGDAAGADAALQASADLIARTGNAYHAAETLRLQGEVACGVGGAQSRDLAVGRFEQALALARRQGARALELRAASSLARLWSDEGQRSRSVNLLGPIHSAIDGGFDTHDLVTARALLAGAHGLDGAQRQGLDDDGTGLDRR